MSTTSITRLARLLLPLAAALAVLAAGGSAGAASANEHLTLSSTTVKGVDHNRRVVAVGAVRATGTFTGKDTNSSRDLITLHFAKGTITLAGHERKTRIVPDLRACRATNTGRGTFTITGGTGAYAGITGNGTYLRHTLMIGARDGKGTCLGQKAPPKLVRYKATVTGTFNLG